MSGLRVDRDGAVLRLQLDRPDARNALDPATVEALIAAVTQVDAGVRVIRLGATGDRAWCAGADLAALAGDPDGRAQAVRRYAQLLTVLVSAPRPVVVVAHAPVMAGGLGLWCAADLAVCSPAVHFSLPESGVGLWPMMVGAVITRCLPERVALDLALTGRRMPAEEALAHGLTNRVEADPEAAADALCWAVASRAPSSVAAGRTAWRRAHPLPDLMALAEALIARMAHPDATEGVLAFLQKRAPVWSDP